MMDEEAFVRSEVSSRKKLYSAFKQQCDYYNEKLALIYCVVIQSWEKFTHICCGSFYVPGKLIYGEHLLVNIVYILTCNMMSVGSHSYTSLPL